jgi:hypothetical protein
MAANTGRLMQISASFCTLQFLICDF